VCRTHRYNPSSTDGRRRRGEFEHSSLMSAQEGKPQLEVECCDSAGDKNLTSPGFADERVLSKR
jgi:hypothetical protein